MASGWGDEIPSTTNTQSSNWGELPPEGGSSTNTTGNWGDKNATGADGWDSTPYGQPHRWITESPINWNLSDEEDEAVQMESENNICENDSFVKHLSQDQYTTQTTAYTEAAVDALINSPEYQRVHTRCQLCWHIWSELQFSKDCVECGGFAMQRPCPICNGKCTKVWSRDIDQSHSNHQAYWDGECGLPQSEQLGYLQQVFMEHTECEEDIIEGLEDLNTG